MKIYHLLLLLALSANVYSQNERVRGMEVKTEPITAPVVNTESKGTIVFKGIGAPKEYFNTTLAFNPEIFGFSSQAEAEAFAAAFKNSDPNIASCTYNNKEVGGYYSFSFSVNEARDASWYLSLFKQNNLQFIRLDKSLKSIDKLLQK